MKILLLAKGYPPTIGGVENYSQYIAEGLGKHHDVEVLTFNETKESPKSIEDKYAKVLRLPYSKNEFINGWTMLKALRKKLSAFIPDIIIATTWKVGLPYSMLTYTYDIPFVVVAHGAEITRHREKRALMELMRFVLRNTDLIITVSDFTKSIVHKYLGKADTKIETVSNGIDMRMIEPIDTETARDRLGVDPERSILLTVSRIDERKGHKQLLELMPRLTEKYPGLLYLIVGDGPLRPKLEAYAKELGLKENSYRFEGFVPDEKLPLYYSAADIFVMLNEMKSDKDFEGFGFVFAEAGAYAKPVIGGDNAGPREVIDHRVTGFLVDPVSEEEILNRLSQLLDDKNKRNSMGRAARQKVLNNFTLDVMVENFEKELSRI